MGEEEREGGGVIIWVVFGVKVGRIDEEGVAVEDGCIVGVGAGVSVCIGVKVKVGVGEGKGVC